VLKAVILDIGGPINDETEQERLFDDAALDAIRRFGDVSAEDYVAICQRVVQSFAPRAYRAILWELAERDTERFEALCHSVRGSGFERFRLRPEVPEVLRRLTQSYKLGIAANSGETMIAQFEQAGIREFFTSCTTAGQIGLYKPNLRYFEHVLAELGVAEQEAVMVGDRVDCDVVPAKMLGMKAVRLRVGRHIEQEPRMPSELPDAEILSLSELPELLEVWAAQP
jgi:FMN phosphatase YigB (HAD superfamily)